MESPTTTEPFGFLSINKPQGLTSHDVVAIVRRQTRIKRIGHIGTLDPLATGMLVLCVGAATRLAEYIVSSDKLYNATLMLGVETDTYDAEGQILAEHDTSHITKAELDCAINGFRGHITQIPPMYSAIKKDGQKLYTLARQGITVERQPRAVHIQAIHVYAYQPPLAHLVIWCSSGTYIRSIAHDLGQVLGVGAHLTALHRRIVGSFQHMTDWSDLLTTVKQGTWTQHLYDERHALAHIGALTLNDNQVNDVVHGRSIPRVRGEADLLRAYTKTGQFLAILEADGDSWHPAKVFHPSA